MMHIVLLVVSVLSLVGLGNARGILVAPGGLRVPHECVYSVPSGSHIEEVGDEVHVHHPSGKRTKIRRCARAIRNYNLDWQVEHPDERLPSALHGPAWKAWAQYLAPSVVTSLVSSWKVPGMPQENTGQILYFWNGVEPGDNTAVLQPVLQWGSTQVGGGAFWGVACWYVSSSHGVITSDFKATSVGATVVGTNTLGKGGVWTIQAEDANTKVATSFTYTPASSNYTDAYHVLEAYLGDQSDCQQYPASGEVKFFDISVEVEGKSATPTWQTDTKNNQCQEHTTVDEGDVTIHF